MTTAQQDARLFLLHRTGQTPPELLAPDDPVYLLNALVNDGCECKECYEVATHCLDCARDEVKDDLPAAPKCACQDLDEDTAVARLVAVTEILQTLKERLATDKRVDKKNINKVLETVLEILTSDK